MLDYFMFFGAPFEIFDPTFVHSERTMRGASRRPSPVWLTSFFSQPSVLPRPQLLSFDNHLDCPRVDFAILISPVLFPLRILSLFSGLHTLCTNRRTEFRPNFFLFFRLRTLAKTMGGVPLRALLSTRFFRFAAPVYNRVSSTEAFS